MIQHTRDSKLAVAELLRVLATGGKGVATHYTAPKRFRSRVQLRLREVFRKYLSQMSQEKLLLLSGVLAATAFILLLGYLFRETIIVANPRMPSLKATWSCTYDAYGSHAFQHYIPLGFGQSGC